MRDAPFDQDLSNVTALRMHTVLQTQYKMQYHHIAAVSFKLNAY